MADWIQQAAVVLVILAAASYLAYRAWLTAQGKASSCGSCKGGGCATDASAQSAKPLLSIELQDKQSPHPAASRK